MSALQCSPEGQQQAINFLKKRSDIEKLVYLILYNLPFFIFELMFGMFAFQYLVKYSILYCAGFFLKSPRKLVSIEKLVIELVSHMMIFAFNSFSITLHDTKYTFIYYFEESSFSMIFCISRKSNCVNCHKQLSFCSKV